MRGQSPLPLSQIHPIEASSSIRSKSVAKRITSFKSKADLLLSTVTQISQLLDSVGWFYSCAAVSIGPSAVRPTELFWLNFPYRRPIAEAADIVPQINREGEDRHVEEKSVSREHQLAVLKTCRTFTRSLISSGLANTSSPPPCTSTFLALKITCSMSSSSPHIGASLHEQSLSADSLCSLFQSQIPQLDEVFSIREHFPAKLTRKGKLPQSVDLIPRSVLEPLVPPIPLPLTEPERIPRHIWLVSKSGLKGLRKYN